MNNIKSEFSIKDLEILTGIKAHTIRIWEKRYNLLSPERTDTNIRKYSLLSFQKILNISYLNKNGIKISKIANLSEEEMNAKVRELATTNCLEDHALNAFKIAMYNFDQALFNNTYNNLIQYKSFKDIFYTVFIPLLNNIGLLWQTNALTPAQEHFITVLIKQKILINIDKLQNLNHNQHKKTFVLFLPDNEIHDLGLLFINYELLCKGYHSIYLGESVPMNNLTNLFNTFNNITFISYFTVCPEDDKVETYLEEFNHLVLKNKNSELLLLGMKFINFSTHKTFDKITVFNSIENLIKIV